MKRRRVIGVTLAVLLAGGGTAALVGYTQSQKDAAVAQEAQVGVYMINKLVPKGSSAETIKANITLGEVPNRLKQPSAVTNLDQISNEKLAGTDLQPGDQLLTVRLVDKVQDIDVPTDKVQVSASFSADRAVGGTVAKGDTVGVYMSFDPFDTNHPQSDTTTPDKTPSSTHLELQHVLVTKVQTTPEPNQPDSGNKAGVDQITAATYVITLALTPEQSERFVFAQEFGHVWLASEAASVTDDGTKLITLGNVYTAVPK
jgi:pilus assembly protein CpaB